MPIDENTPDDAPITLSRGTLHDWITWASRGAIGILFTLAAWFGTWAINAETRLHDVEQYGPRLAKLEAREDANAALVTDIAVVKSKLDAQDKQLAHITALLEASAAR